jgi:hypothetical protein
MRMATETTSGPGAPVVCRYVRSKGAGVTYGDPVRWDNGYFPSAVFWCLRTADAVGPDDSFVHPHVCIVGRGCFCGPISDRADGD